MNKLALTLMAMVLTMTFSTAFAGSGCKDLYKEDATATTDDYEKQEACWKDHKKQGRAKACKKLANQKSKGETIMINSRDSLNCNAENRPDYSVGYKLGGDKDCHTSTTVLFTCTPK